MGVATTDLWDLTLSGRPLDAAEFADALQREAAAGQPDFRTRLLIRDALHALAQHWGAAELSSWISRSPAAARLQQLAHADLGPPGFPSLAHRLMDTTRPDTVMQFLRELGVRVRAPLPIRLE